MAILREKDAINRPNLNRGLIIFWLRNEHIHAWDPYSGHEGSVDDGLEITGNYLEKWGNDLFYLSNHSL